MQEVDFKVIEKAQKGDKAAFDKIITTYRTPITALCHKYMRNAEEALDMSQEVFCTAYKSLDKFQFKSRISTWLYRIAVNLCINRLDAMKRRKYFVTESIHEDSEQDKFEIHIPDKARPHDEEMVAAEMKKMIMDELDKFPAADKNLVILRDMQGYEYSEIAEILKMPVGSVKSKLSRAREKLKDRITKKLGDTK